MLKSISNFLLVSTALITISCGSNTKSGPCDYTDEKFNMYIVDVAEDPNQENMYIITVDFDGAISYANSSHTLSEVRNVVTDYDFVINNHMKPGTIYTGTVHLKKEGSGDCEDEIIDWNQKLIK